MTSMTVRFNCSLKHIDMILTDTPLRSFNGHHSGRLVSPPRTSPEQHGATVRQQFSTYIRTVSHCVRLELPNQH